MSKAIKKVASFTLPGMLFGALKGKDKTVIAPDKKSPDELAAEAEEAEERRRRNALGRQSTIQAGTLGGSTPANVGARLLSGK